MFNHEGPVVIRAMRDITVGLFGHVEIVSNIDLGIRIKCTECILRNLTLKKFNPVFLACK